MSPRPIWPVSGALIDAAKQFAPFCTQGHSRATVRKRTHVHIISHGVDLGRRCDEVGLLFQRVFVIVISN